MIVFLLWLLGAVTASSWWAAAIWGYKQETQDLSGLWAVTVLLTLGTVLLFIYIAIDEDTP